ncbi:MAG: response regulator transcription factor [Planctomycetota bacterium]|jgi:DNA-binding NarL/FixJ family response regulator|nr:response regulator transcription factor [Planctomycetota bacterium]
MITTDSLKLFLVDDHPLLRKGIKSLLEEEEGMEVCGEAGTAEDALTGMRELYPDVALVDLTLPGIDGIELVKRARAQFPEMKLLVVSLHDESIYAERALKAGANGYIMKRAGTEELIQAVRKVASGEIYVSANLSDRVLRQFAGDLDTELPENSLSDRELQVFRLVGDGMSTREVAGRLHLSIKTVEAHRANIMKKLGVDSAPQLVKRAVEWVILHDRRA